MTDNERRLLMALGRAIAHLPPGGRVELLSAVWAVEEEGKNAEELAPYDDELVTALRLILKEPHGCPMCDSGKLRNPAKEHWDACGFARAVAALLRRDAAIKAGAVGQR